MNILQFPPLFCIVFLADRGEKQFDMWIKISLLPYFLYFLYDPEPML